MVVVHKHKHTHANDTHSVLNSCGGFALRSLVANNNKKANKRQDASRSPRLFRLSCVAVVSIIEEELSQ